MDSVRSHHVCCREDMFDSLKNCEDTIHLSDGSSCAIEDIETVSMKVHDGIVRKLDEAQYISSFKRNLISLSRLDSISYK